MTEPNLTPLTYPEQARDYATWAQWANNNARKNANEAYDAHEEIKAIQEAAAERLHLAQEEAGRLQRYADAIAKLAATALAAADAAADAADAAYSNMQQADIQARGSALAARDDRDDRATRAATRAATHAAEARNQSIQASDHAANAKSAAVTAKTIAAKNAY